MKTIFDFDFEALSIFKVLGKYGPGIIQKTITGLFPLAWQDGIGGDLVDYSLTGASGGVGDYGGKRNQLADYTKIQGTYSVGGIDFTKDGNSYRVSGTATQNVAYDFLWEGMNTVSGHKYFVFGCPTGGDEWTYFTDTNQGRDYGNGVIFTSNGSRCYSQMVIKNGVTVNHTVYFNIIDLTAMFPTDTPTDVSTAKARIAEVMGGQQEYYPYDSGTDYYKVPMVVTSGACVDLGTLNWYVGQSNEFRVDVSASVFKTPSSNTELANIYCHIYDTVSAIDTYVGTKGIGLSASLTDPYITVYDNSYTDAASFKSAMSGVYLYYQRATDESWYIQNKTIYRTTQLTANQTIRKTTDGLPNFTDLPTGYLQMGVDTEVQPSAGSVTYKSRSVSI